MQKLYHGAEAVITKEEGAVKKERISKGYRIRQIDEALRVKRTRAEAKLIRAAGRAGVMVPQVLAEEKFTIKMEFIDGKKAKDAIDTKNMGAIAGKIGENAATLHSYNIIHGDMTTSNMILKAKSSSEQGAHNHDLYVIDFGLGFFSGRIEDKATDMHLLKECLESTHFDLMQKMWEIITDTYTNNCSDGDKVIKALSKIERRGRYAGR